MLRCAGWVTFGALLFSRSGSLARVTPLIHTVKGFRPVLMCRYEFPMGRLATLRQASRLPCFCPRGTESLVRLVETQQ